MWLNILTGKVRYLTTFFIGLCLVVTDVNQQFFSKFNYISLKISLIYFYMTIFPVNDFIHFKFLIEYIRTIFQKMKDGW
jgi:hypothetical protein